MANQEFGLWLEYENWDAPAQDKSTKFRGGFLMEIHLLNGDVHCYYAWTYNDLQNVINENRDSGEWRGGQYVMPPDILIERYDCELINEIVAEIIQNNGLLSKDRLKRTGDHGTTVVAR